MNYKPFFVTCITFLLFCAAIALAGADYDISGQVRVRHEVDSRQFHDDGTTKEYADMRTRIQVGATVDGNAHAVVQFQDTRRLGGTVNGQ